MEGERPHAGGRTDAPPPDAPGWSSLAVIGLARPAGADGTGDAYNDEDEIGVGRPRRLDGGSAGDRRWCKPRAATSRSTTPARPATADGRPTVAGTEQPGPGPARWYRRICDHGNGATEVTIVWLPDRPSTPRSSPSRPWTAPDPAPEIRLNPPAGEEQVVNVPTWMWLDRSAWQPVSATASAGAVTVTATASPRSVRWDMGNGDVVVCDGPGTPYDPARPAGDRRATAPTPTDGARPVSPAARTA